MNALISWLKEIFGYKVTFNNIERIVLQRVRQDIGNSEIIALWDKQIFTINKIQRIVNRETNFYRKVNGKVVFDESYRFPNTQKELFIAKLKLKFPSLGILSVKVLCLEGYLFSLKYGKDISEFEKFLKKENHPEIDVFCTILGDLSLSNSSD